MIMVRPTIAFLPEQILHPQPPPKPVPQQAPQQTSAVAGVTPPASSEVVREIPVTKPSAGLWKHTFAYGHQIDINVSPSEVYNYTTDFNLWGTWHEETERVELLNSSQLGHDKDNKCYEDIKIKVPVVGYAKDRQEWTVTKAVPPSASNGYKGVWVIDGHSIAGHDNHTVIEYRVEPSKSGGTTYTRTVRAENRLIVAGYGLDSILRSISHNAMVKLKKELEPK